MSTHDPSTASPVTDTNDRYATHGSLYYCGACGADVKDPDTDLQSRYPCGDHVPDAPECDSCVQDHIETCGHCVVAIRDAEDRR
jgi:hypothetical protein